MISRESCGQIFELLDGLKDSWKEVTVMYFIQEMTTDEISKRLEITNDMCRSRISRARKYLREKIKKIGNEIASLTTKQRTTRI